MSAKKKKQTRSKKQLVEETAEHSPFWSLAGGILLCLTALFLLLGGFGTGGPLPVSLFKGAYVTFGWAAYLTPVALVYWGVYKFISEDRRIPLAKLISVFCVLLFTSSWLYVAFANRDSLGAWTGGHGGGAGRIAGGMVLNALDKMPAGILFFVLTVLSVFFAFGISPKVIMNLFSMFKQDGEENEGTDLATLKSRAEHSEFKLIEGVPVEHYGNS